MYICTLQCKYLCGLTQLYALCIVLAVCSGYSTITMITCCSGCDCGVHLQTLILSPDTVYVVGCIWRKVRYCECHPITDRQCYDFVSVVDCAVVIMFVPSPVDADLYLIVCHLQYLYGLSICMMWYGIYSYIQNDICQKIIGTFCIHTHV